LITANRLTDGDTDGDMLHRKIFIRYSLEGSPDLGMRRRKDQQLTGE